MGWHPFFGVLREHARSKPQAVEDHPWGETVYKVHGKVFVFLGAPERAQITVKAPPDELDLLLGVPYIQRAKYVGRYGWITVTIEDEPSLDLARQLVDDSYQLIGAGQGRRRAS